MQPIRIKYRAQTTICPVNRNSFTGCVYFAKEIYCLYVIKEIYLYEKERSISMASALAEAKICTEEDYNNMPENVRAELIGGQLYYMSAPSRNHQKIPGFLYNRTANYINCGFGLCEVYPALFAVKLFDNNTIWKILISTWMLILLRTESRPVFMMISGLISKS